VNAAAVRALPAAIADREYVRTYVAESERSRELYEAVCARLGLQTWKSAANFVLIRIGGRVSEVAAALAERGIHARNRSHQPGCEGCLRLTAGWVADTQRAIAALEEVL
jgi:histidinol-phosphate aminotransferase